jgi:hypothetical protein
VIDGQNLTFDDRREVAIARAAYCKQGKYKHQLCRVRVRATGELLTVQADGQVT